MRYVNRLGVAVALVGLAVAGARTVAAQGGMPAPAGVHPMKVSSGMTVLADGKMMTLYTYAKDAPGVSNCNDMCAKNWPPLMAAPDAKPMGDWTVITRADGSRQWAYKGMPLYRWIKDMNPGDAGGEGMGNGAWKVAVP